MLYLDIDRIDNIFDPYWLWSSKGFNIATFKRNKYMMGSKEPIKTSVIKFLQQKGHHLPEKIYLLTNLAYYGYCFNPISLYFCLKNHEIQNCIVEVTNTPWGEQKDYLLTPYKKQGETYFMKFHKALHVSPFMSMDYEYLLKCKLSQESIVIHIENWKNKQCDFDATLSLRSIPINQKNLNKILLRFPFMTGKIIAAIYWQSLRLYLKNVPVVYHP